MRYFTKTNGIVMAFEDDQVTSIELENAISSACDALKSTVEYVEFESAKAALDLAKAASESCDEYIELEAAKEALKQYQIAVQRVESAQSKYESCDEYIALERLKNTKVWIPDDAVEMTESEIEAHLNPPISDEQLAVTARAQRDTLIYRVSREVERRQDAGEVVTAWREYRQFLRDIPDQEKFPHDIDWGVQPDEFTGK